MSLSFQDITPGQVIELPGRKGKPDLWEVVRVYNGRVVLESRLRGGDRKVMMANQFNKAGYEPFIEMAERKKFRPNSILGVGPVRDRALASPRHPGVMGE